MKFNLVRRAMLLGGLVVSSAMMGVGATEIATPQSDYYTYVNQKWLTETKIPVNKASISNFYILDEATETKLKSLLNDYSANYDSLKKGTNDYKLTTYYKMARDFKKRDELGFNPIKPYILPIEQSKNINDFSLALEKVAKDGHFGPVNFAVEPDEKNNSKNILYIGTPNLGLAKEYLLGTDDYSQKLRKAYIVYLTQLFQLDGDKKDIASKKANAVLEISIKEASAILPKEKQSERELFYNVRTWQEISAIAPNLPIYEIAEELGLSQAQKIIVTEPKALEMMNSLYTEKNLFALKAQMEALILQNHVLEMSKDGIIAATKFKEAAIGTYDLDSDDKLAYKLTNASLGEMLGKVYVGLYFPASAKLDVLNMVHEIQTAYKERISQSEWMSKETQAQAIDKINAMTIKIGYPDKWTDYDKLSILGYKEGGNLVQNSVEIARFEMKKYYEHLNKTPDKTEWAMTPQTINAYYNPVFNEIVFPAAILQAPFYSVTASKESNLGAIGAVIGHEISHGFDNSGAQYDKNGNLHNWWKKEDYEKFQKKVKKAAEFYSNFEVLPGYYVNGTISTGEIFGDLGGVTIAIAIANNQKLDTKKVFRAYAKVWRNKMTPEAIIGRLIDEHPPGKYRVNGIVQQIEQFYKDYDVKPGDAMYIPKIQRFRVW